MKLNAIIQCTSLFRKAFLYPPHDVTAKEEGVAVGATMVQALGVVEGGPFLALFLASFLLKSCRVERQAVRIDQEIAPQKEDEFPRLENHQEQLECSMKKVRSIPSEAGEGVEGESLVSPLLVTKEVTLL